MTGRSETVAERVVFPVRGPPTMATLEYLPSTSSNQDRGSSTSPPGLAPFAVEEDLDLHLAASGRERIPELDRARALVSDPVNASHEDEHASQSLVERKPLRVTGLDESIGNLASPSASDRYQVLHQFPRGRSLKRTTTSTTSSLT